MVENAAGFALALAALGLAGAMRCSSSNGIGSCVSFCEKEISCFGVDAGSNATAECQGGCNEMFDAGGLVACNMTELYDCLNSLSCTDLRATPSRGFLDCIRKFCPNG